MIRRKHHLKAKDGKVYPVSLRVMTAKEHVADKEDPKPSRATVVTQKNTEAKDG